MREYVAPQSKDESDFTWENLCAGAGAEPGAREISFRLLIPCLLNHCGKHERLEVLQGLAEGNYPALVANQVLDEGDDLPQVNAAFVVGKAESGLQFAEAR